MWKKKLAIGLGLTLAMSALAGCSSTGSSTSGPVKIGVIMPLSGQVSAFGQSGQKGLQLLEEQTNSAGGINGRKVSFVFMDDENKAATSVSAAQKLITSDKVVAIVGPLTSTCANSVAPIAQKYKVPMVTGTGTNANITKAGDYIFRTCFIDPFQGTVVAKFAFGDLKAKTAAVLYNNGDDYSKGLADNFKKSFEGAGGKVVDSETYNTGDKDFNVQLTKIAGTKPDVLMLPDYYNTTAVIAKEARAMGITATFLGGDGWDSADLFTIGGSAVNNSYFSNHYSPDENTPEVVQFIKDYKAKYNNEVPDAMAALNYDAGKVLIQSITKAGKTDGASVRSALKAYDGTVVSGHITFDKNRDAVKPAVIIVTKDGKEQFFKTVNP